MRREPSDRCIDKAKAHFSRQPRQEVGRLGIDGAHVDDKRARLGMGENTAGTGNDLPDGRRIGQHGDDDLGLRGRLGDTLGAARLELLEFGDRVPD